MPSRQEFLGYSVESMPLRQGFRWCRIQTMNGIYAFAARVPWNLCLRGKGSVRVGFNDSKQWMESMPSRPGFLGFSVESMPLRQGFRWCRMIQTMNGCDKIVYNSKLFQNWHFFLFISCRRRNDQGKRKNTADRIRMCQHLHSSVHSSGCSSISRERLQQYQQRERSGCSSISRESNSHF